MKIAVTGGAGFIGSHIVASLLFGGHEVVVIDDLSSGRKDNVDTRAVFVKKDLRNDIADEIADVEALFHFAADPDVRASVMRPEDNFAINVAGTFNVLEACRKADVKRIIIASTSTVYGQPQIIPTPEDHPCIPISNYAAGKLACEAYVSSYSALYGMKGTSFRFANIYGERSTHGVMYDLYNKLLQNPKKLEILGNGKQDKSYLYISDCVSAVLAGWKNQKRSYDVFNVGSTGKITVDDLAHLVCNIMGLEPNLEHIFSPETTMAGWNGDVNLMLLDTTKLASLGWKQEVPLEIGVKKYLSFLEKSSS